MITSFIAFGLVYSFILSFTSLRVKFYSKTIARESTFAIKTLQESLNGIRDVIMSKAENHFISRYKNSITKVRNAQGNNTIIGAAPRHNRNNRNCINCRLSIISKFRNSRFSISHPCSWHSSYRCAAYSSKSTTVL